MDSMLLQAADTLKRLGTDGKYWADITDDSSIAKIDLSEDNNEETEDYPCIVCCACDHKELGSDTLMPEKQVDAQQNDPRCSGWKTFATFITTQSEDQNW